MERPSIVSVPCAQPSTISRQPRPLPCKSNVSGVSDTSYLKPINEQLHIVFDLGDIYSKILHPVFVLFSFASGINSIEAQSLSSAPRFLALRGCSFRYGNKMQLESVCWDARGSDSRTRRLANREVALFLNASAEIIQRSLQFK